MSHRLFLGMYSFSIKKPRVSNKKLLNNNDFLSMSYPSIENKFSEGFAKDIINFLDQKAYKNAEATHGAILDEKSINSGQRTIDLMIDGGLTGIKQFIIDENGERSVLSDHDIVGPKFFARIWLPANTCTGYIFIQKYGSLSIKPIFDSILLEIVKFHELSLLGKRIRATTTKKRLNQFLKHSSIKDITLLSTESRHQTGTAEAKRATIKLKGFKINKNSTPSTKEIHEALDKHGIKLDSEKDYQLSVTYENNQYDVQERKTTKYLDNSEETINIIPSIIIPEDHIDLDNYPIFEKMQEFVNDEMKQIMTETF